MPGVDSITQLLRKSAAGGSKSTVLNPLAWLVAIEFAGLAASLKYGAPEWVIQVIVGLLVLSAVVYVAAYVFFGLTNSDALRSERFFLSKLAIEKSARGDNLVGLLEPGTFVEENLLPNVPAAPTPTEKQ